MFFILQVLRTVNVHSLNKKLVVQRLEDLAFEASHREILSRFPDFRNYYYIQIIICFIRESVNAYLNQHLAGAGVLRDIVRYGDKVAT